MWRLCLGFSNIYCSEERDNLVRWVSDFRDLNAQLKCKLFPLPCIHDIMNRCG